MGAFEASFSSDSSHEIPWNIPRIPLLFYRSPHFNPDSEGFLIISWFGRAGEDPRNDQRVIEALQKQGLYRGGLSVLLTSIEILQNTDTATISYSYEITNNDCENLYVFDPLLMGAERFQYYIDGPSLVRTVEPDEVHRSYDRDSVHRDLLSVDATDVTIIITGQPGQSHYVSDRRDVVPPEPYDHWEPTWFAKIPSGETMARTVIVTGYPQLEPGNYESYFAYSGLHYFIDSSQRQLPDGRYWLGIVHAPVYEMTVNVR